MATGGITQESKSSPELAEELSFDYLREITNDFSDDRKLGASQFGTLYKGIREDGTVIAVKKLQNIVDLPADKTFKAEVQHIMDLKHENIVQLVGFCTEEHIRNVVEMNDKHINVVGPESLLCYEYLPIGNLDEILFGTKATEGSFDWDTRFKVIKGICQGLLFLHKLERPIIHMDLNNRSVWLGENMVPKIGNFGISRLFRHKQTRTNTEIIVGSIGHMAPEYLYLGEISAKADIYSLGLMIMEISTREKNLPIDKQPSGKGYIENIRRDWTAEHIASQYPSYDAESLQQVYACIEIGLECVQVDRTKRPSIEQIVDKLNTI